MYKTYLRVFCLNRRTHHKKSNEKVYISGLVKESWEEGPNPSKTEVQYILDLIAELHTLGQLSLESFLKAQESTAPVQQRNEIKIVCTRR